MSPQVFLTKSSRTGYSFRKTIAAKANVNPIARKHSLHDCNFTKELFFDISAMRQSQKQRNVKTRTLARIQDSALSWSGSGLEL